MASNVPRIPLPVGILSHNPIPGARCVVARIRISGFPGIYGVFRFCLLFLLLIISLIRVLRLAAGGEVRESFVSFGVITFRASTFMLSLLWLILKTTKEAAKSFHHTFVRELSWVIGPEVLKGSKLLETNLRARPSCPVFDLPLV